MTSPIIGKGFEFQNREQVTNIKLHDLIDKATWTVTSQAIGDIARFDGTDWVRIPAGTNGQVLTMVDGVPAWATP